MPAMQQRLAVASVLVLALLAGASAFLIQSHAFASTPKTSSQTQGTQTSQTTNSAANTNSTAGNGGSLLTNPTHNQTGYGDDGNETEHETESDYGANSTMDS